MDEVQEIFKGQFSDETLFKNMSYKDMLSLRDVRVKRLMKEREQQEIQMKKDEAEQKRLAAKAK